MLNTRLYSGADPGILFRVGIFCLLISNFNTYNTKKGPNFDTYNTKKGQKLKYIVYINKK